MFKVGDKVKHHTCVNFRCDLLGREYEVSSTDGNMISVKGGMCFLDTDLQLIPVEATRKEDVMAPLETIVTDPKTGGQKGQKLAQMGALDPRALLAVGEVGGFGAKKYARYNFMKGYAWSLSYDALQRHLHAFWGGQNRDEESGLYHLAHATWHCLALLTFVIRGLGTDDRPPQ